MLNKPASTFENGLPADSFALAKIEQDEYNRYLCEVESDIRSQARAGRKDTLQDIVGLLQPDRDNRLIRNLCAELDIGTRREFDREIFRARQRRELGVAPCNATELMKAYAQKHSLTATYDQMLKRDVKAVFRDPSGNEIPITPADRDADAVVELYASIHCDRQSRMTRADLERELRILSSNLQMNFRPQDIVDAVEEWLKIAQRERLHDIFVGVERIEHSFAPKAHWIQFASEVFDCSDTSPEYVAAVLQTVIWSVKRKIRGMPVTDHLMPVILGPQGIGKSTFVQRFLEPVSELKLDIDFQMITDERNVDIWSYFVMFVDEMGYASKADIDTIKNIITAKNLTRRPMRSNGKLTIDQNATFIGCSNRELGQLIRDPTGLRRFVGIRMRSDANRDLINSLDWGLMWGSVKIGDPHPMSAHREMLAQEQDRSRDRSRVEQWLIDFTGANRTYQATINQAGNISARDLHLAFREYEDEAFPGSMKTSKTEWEREMQRLEKNSPEVVAFSKTRGGSGMMYRWRNEPMMRIA